MIDRHAYAGRAKALFQPQHKAVGGALHIGDRNGGVCIDVLPVAEIAAEHRQATVLAAKVDFAQVLNNETVGALVNNVVALGIAVTKASLVVLFFMHVKYESKLVGLAVVASVIWLAFLILITMSDYLTRTADWHLFTR